MGDVVVDRREHGLWLQLNRPERMNAYDRNTIDELVTAFREHVDARVVVITGTNGAFCAGGYLANLTTPDFWELRSLFMGSLELFDTIRNAPMPVIAAVNGGAFGGGNELVVCCDLAIAAESAQLGQTGVRVGSAPVLGGTNLLAMTVGEKRAKEVSFLCRKYSAKQAMDLGWINHVVPDDELEDEVDRWCQELAAMSPRYMELAKASSNVMYHQFRDNMVQGLNSLIQAIGSSDMKEGAAAFMDKRRPNFSPRDEL
jgi:enoyl-CoA hydratase/carnithine racemase|tara:strand:- start:3543 stop:4313 length:771 start_codon:yes stop_codon:yes gene_type:complete